MAIPKIIGAQRDFSAGEIDVALKRADEHPARKAGVRQMSNSRILNSGAVKNRPGRRALFPSPNSSPRIEEFTLSPGNVFTIAFGNQSAQINSAGTLVATMLTQGNGAALPWTTATVNQIVYAILNLSIYITFPGMRPQVLTWDGVSTWTIADYNELASPSSQKRTPFYRLSPKGVTLLPSAATGAITVTFSSAIAVAGMTGTRVRWAGRQILLGSLINSSQMNATVIEPLPPSQTLAITGAIGNYAVGDAVIGSVSGAQGIVESSPSQQTVLINAGGTGTIHVGDSVTGGTTGATGFITAINGLNINIQLSTSTAFSGSETITGNGGAWTRTTAAASTTALVVQLISNTASSIRFFTTSDTLVGPTANAGISTVTAGAPQAITVWDDEVINSFRGFPASVFVDQFRLGFCNFPAVPGGIAWSAINSPTDLYVDGQPSNAMFEITPDKTQVYYVVPGPESSEFVFCDKKVYYIPISESNPLKSGSVSFQILSNDGAGQVQPRAAQELLLYANAGRNSIMAIIASGAYLRPFNTKNLSQYHQHLFNNITAIAAPTADGTFLERYAYVLNGDNSITVGKYILQTVLADRDPIVGWGPWSGGGTVSWIAAWSADVLFTSNYFGAIICETVDDTYYLDGALLVNSLPAAFTPPGGKGPLWWIPSQTVTLMDQGYRMMGTYQIDANGFIIPQNNAGENLSAATLVAGQPWTMTLEPFVPDANPGNSAHQRMFKRRVSRMAVYVSNSTGFLLARLFSGPLTRTSPAIGATQNQRRVTAWNQDDNPTLPPPLREEAQRWRPLGRSFDARVALIKDTPGPLTVHEFGLEASI